MSSSGGGGARAAGTTQVGSSTFTYYDALRITGITHKDGSAATLASYVYAYDAGSRLTNETIDGTLKTYTYSANDELTGDGTSTWTFDANGNRTSGGSTPTTGNRLTTDGTWTYAYDDEGNVTQKTAGSTVLDVPVRSPRSDDAGPKDSVERRAVDRGLYLRTVR